MFFYSETQQNLIQTLNISANVQLVSFIPSIPVSSSSSSSFIVSATGGQTTENITITDDTDQFSYSPASFTLTSGSSQVVNVTFSPTSLGTKTGSIFISSSGGSTDSVSLYGLVVEQYYNNTSLLIKADDYSFDLSGSVNYFVDSSKNNLSITKYGNTTRTSAQSKYGGYSFYFDGNGDYLTVPSSTEFDFGAGNFTIEMWINPPLDSNGAQSWLFGKRASTSVYSSVLSFLTYNTAASKYAVAFYATVNGTSWTTMSTGYIVPINTWTHLAYVRNGNEYSIFINGVKTQSFNLAGSVTSNSSPFAIGAIAAANPGTSGFTGYVDDIRVTKGIARYTTNFTPSEI